MANKKNHKQASERYANLRNSQQPEQQPREQTAAPNERTAAPGEVRQPREQTAAPNERTAAPGEVRQPREQTAAPKEREPLSDVYARRRATLNPRQEPRREVKSEPELMPEPVPAPATEADGIPTVEELLAEQSREESRSAIEYEPHDQEDDYGENVFVEQNVRTAERVESARRREEERRAQRSQKLQNTLVDAPTTSIFLNEDEISEEKDMSGRKSKKIKSKETIPALFKNRTRPRSYVLSVLFTIIRMLIICILVMGFSGLGGVFGLAKAYVESIPEIDFNAMYNQELSSIIYDVNGNELMRYYGSENREWANFEEIPQDLRDAFVAVEDVRFYRHIGIDFKRLIGSVILNFTSNSLQGGSTITQQLVKNTVLSSEQTYKRKIREAYLAIKMEQQYEKDEILEAYLNTIPLGGLVYGVKTAAKDFFGKELSELTLRECATIAGMTQNPTRYNPRLNYYVRNTPERTNNRTDNVLNEMYTNGFINYEEYRAALLDKLEVCEVSPLAANYEMLYFVEYAIHDAITQLMEINNLSDTSENRSLMDKLIRTEGYSIYTTLDPEKQRAAENAVFTYNNYPAMRDSKDNYTTIGYNPDGSVRTLIQPQAASVVIDYRNGFITAVVGGRQQVTGQKEFNRAYSSTMPVGSAIKPLAVYGPAIEAGLAPGTIFYDTRGPIQGWVSDTGFAYPRNYNDSGYNGAMTMRTALTKSTNTVAAQMLMYYVGFENAYNTLVALGVNPSHIHRDGPGLALGTSGITPLEMAGAYSAIANMGEYIEPISFTKITDSTGNVVMDMVAKQEHRQVYKQSTAYLLIDMLTSALKTNRSAALIDGQTVGGKTGTTMESRGVFFAGFSGYYACAVWIGSDAYKMLVSRATGASYATKLWHNIMEPLHTDLPDRSIASMTAAQLGIEKVKFCKYSGKLANDACPETVSDIGLVSDLITDTCTCHQFVNICTDTNCLANDACPHKKTITVTTVPTSGQLFNIYTLAPEIYMKYWEPPTEAQIPCQVHTETWAEENQQKQNMRPLVRVEISRAELAVLNDNLEAFQVQKINELLQMMQSAYDNPDSVTYLQYSERYNNLKSYLDTLGL